MKEKFNVYGMTCASCQAHVDKAVRKLDGVKSVNVNLLSNNMVVDYEGITSNDIISAVVSAGYNASLASNDTKKEVINKTKDNTLRDLIISIILLLVLMYFSMGVMMWGWPTFKVFDMEECPMGFALIEFLITIPIVYINRRYFISGFKKLFKGPNMDSLIAVGASFSLAYSIYCLFMIALGKSHYHMYLYFESCGMILVFVSIGKYLEGLSKRKTTSALESLMDLAPKTCTILVNDTLKEVMASDVKIGDIVVCKKGEKIAVDGRIIEGQASIDEANITGESMPVFKTIGDNVYSSTTLNSGYLKIEALKVGDDTSIASIIKLVEEASNSKAPISRLADKISGIFVPIIFSIAIITFIANILYSSIKNPFGDNAFEIAFNFAITVIVIACPCALGLATPVAIMVGTGKGASLGLLIKNAEILEKASLIKTVVVDKTGTLTKGSPEVCDFKKYSDDDLSSILYSFEYLSEHPLAKATVEYTNDLKTSIYDIKDYKSIDGMGLTGYIGEDFYEIGNEKFIKENKHKEEALSYSKEGKTVLYILKNHDVIGIITLKDNLKETSIEAVKTLKKKGIKVIMLTGDKKETAEAIAAEAGITDVIPEVLPTDKADIIKSLKSDDKHLVAMTGDGVNDAIALKCADLGIAVGSGSDVALDSSDIILLKNDLMGVVNVIDLSKRVLNTIKLGLFWAFFYNIICVFLATGILYYLTDGKFKMEPMYGAIAMSISSVSVVLNALTINLFKVKDEDTNMNNDEIILNVKGMMCEHCKKHVEEAVLNTKNVTNVNADYKSGKVSIKHDGEIDLYQIKEAIKEAGYEVK